MALSCEQIVKSIAIFILFPHIAAMTKLVTLWKNAKIQLENSGIESPTIDARILLIDAFEISRNDLVTDPYRIIDDEKIAKLDAYITRRIKREPVAHIIGKKAFWNIELKSDARALVPRPETEVIIDFILKYHKNNEKLEILDLGTGTGAILLALLAERSNWCGLGIDISQDALDLSLENALIHGLEKRAQFQIGNWCENIGTKYDIVVSNPPYIPSDDIKTLDSDVKDFDPHLALDGGEDGLNPYRIIFEKLPNLLKSGGIFAFEFGMGQAQAIKELAIAQSDLHEIHILKDLSNHERVIIGKRK